MVELGLSPSAAWSLSPLEFFECYRAWRAKRRVEDQRWATLTHYAAAAVVAEPYECGPEKFLLTISEKERERIEGLRFLQSLQRH